MLSTCAVHVVLPVLDFEKARDFYRDTLELEIVKDDEDMSFAIFEAGEGTVIEIFQSDSKKSEDTAASFIVEDLDKEMNDLKKKGVVFEEYDNEYVTTKNGIATMGPHRASWFKDPAGNILSLFERGDEEQEEEVEEEE